MEVGACVGPGLMRFFFNVSDGFPKQIWIRVWVGELYPVLFWDVLYNFVNFALTV